MVSSPFWQSWKFHISLNCDFEASTHTYTVSVAPHNYINSVKEYLPLQLLHTYLQLHHYLEVPAQTSNEQLF